MRVHVPAARPGERSSAARAGTPASGSRSDGDAARRPACPREVDHAQRRCRARAAAAQHAPASPSEAADTAASCRSPRSTSVERAGRRVEHRRGVSTPCRADASQPAVGAAARTTARRAATAARRTPPPSGTAAAACAVEVGAVQVPPAGAVADRVERARRRPTPAAAPTRSSPPSRVRHAVTAPSAPSSPTRSSVPSHGICGWSQAIQASRRPSGDSRGQARKCEPPTTDRTATGVGGGAPSSGTATMSRRIVPPACASRTHQTSPPPRSSPRSAYRRPAGAGRSGVSGTGASAAGRRAGTPAGRRSRRRPARRPRSRPRRRRRTRAPGCARSTAPAARRDRAVGTAAQHGVPALLARHQLGPPEVRTDEASRLHRVLAAREVGGADRRDPGPVRRDSRHGRHCPGSGWLAG